VLGSKPVRTSVLFTAETVAVACAEVGGALSLFTLRSSRFFGSVPLERLSQQASLVRPVLEEVNDADRGIGALDAGLDQRKIPGVAEPELVKPVGLAPADIARGGAARRIGILVMSNQRLPVFVSRPLHGFADLLPGAGHVSPLAGSQPLTRHCSRASSAPPPGPPSEFGQLCPSGRCC
jgi:hypothetical protein